jgi:hypothetical protein
VDLDSALLGAIGTAVLWAGKEIFIPDFLDRHKQRRAAELQRAAEQRAYDREDAPVRARIVSAILELLRFLQRALLHRAISLAEWQILHNKLHELVDCDSGSRALGETYLPLMELVNFNRLGINVQASIEARGETHFPSLQAQYDAQFTLNIATKLLRFLPILDSLGVNTSNDDFSKIAVDALASAKQTISQMTIRDDS